MNYRWQNAHSEVNCFIKMLFVAGCDFVRVNESSWVKWVVQTSHLLHRSLLKERYKRISSRYVNVNLQGRDTKRGGTSRLGQNGLARKLGEKRVWPFEAAPEKKLTEFYFLCSGLYFLCTLMQDFQQNILRSRLSWLTRQTVWQTDRQMDDWVTCFWVTGGQKHVAWLSVVHQSSYLGHLGLQN